ncbi:MAG: peptide-methionine (R)-S-oxide reductase MsrB [Verrucomicrobiota bacterium]|nr:peptide-methionine (R)-S-oxide reductase MsrB [Verrucomicrobiota bacterium]
MKHLTSLLLGAFLTASVFAADEQAPQPSQPNMNDKVEKTDAEWKAQLTPQQYYVLREKGTEAPFKNEYNDNHEKGIFRCAACAKELYSSDAKFESGTGWPSFFQPISPDAVRTESDRKMFIKRTEVLCARCGGHLGHVFDDGPQPTGLRYCMNSVAMKFEKQP